jgi:tetratricopeptide (TPR) repeat protein
MEVGFNQHRPRSGGGPGRRRAALVAALLAAGVLASCGDRARVYFDEARRLELDYEFEKAARKYELVATAFKRSPLRREAEAGLGRCRAELLFDRAEELIYDGAAYTAIPEVAAGRRLDPDNPRGLYLVGIAHRYLGPRELALEEFDDIVKRYPESPYGYLGRAEYSRFYLRREDALDDYVRAFRIAHRDPRNRGAAWRGIRDMIIKLERPEEEAERYRREARGTTPPDALDYWIGYYYLRKKPRDYRVAVRYFGDVIAADGSPSYRARARAARAECYLRFRDLARAKRDIDAALAADPENGEYYKIADKIYRGLSLPPPRKTQK